MKKPKGRYESLRKRAEAFLNESGQEDSILSSMDMRTLIHDLSVHQVELEMQNDELMQAQRDLQLARDEYQSLYNNAPVGYLSLDGRGMILRHNQTFANMFGAAGFTFVGTGISPLLAAEDRDLFLARFKAFFRMPEGKNIDVRFARPDGNVFWGRITGRLDGDAEAGKARLLVTVLDIGAEKRASDALLKARDEAEAANSAKSQFLSNVSHEIRTPMNGILGMAQLLGMTDLTQDQKTFVDLINVSGKNLVSLINSVLDLSKIESGRLELDHSEFSLTRCLRNTVESLAPVAGLKGLDVGLDIADDLPETVEGDEMRLVQIVTNLVSNAIKFTERGSVKIRVKPERLEARHCFIALSVSDTGIGIDPADYGRIFEPFVQSGSPLSRPEGGSGLGLSICRRLAELMGGSISVESVAGKGSVFRVRLPFFLPPAANESAGPRQATGSAPALRVLVVEDNGLDRFYLKRALQKMGHTALMAVDGRQALDMWRREDMDCILMDIRLPELSGDEAAAVIRVEEGGSDRRTPILALSAFALAEEKAAFMAAGFDAYLTKPVLYDVLEEALGRVAVERAGTQTARD
jgi:PAS domain S-box-containing protein